MSAHVSVCVRLSPVPVIYPKYLLRCLCLPVCCTPPSQHTLPFTPTPNNLSSHTPNPHTYGLCCWSRCHANSPLSLGGKGSDLSPLCLLLETVDNCRLKSSYFLIKTCPKSFKSEALAPKRSCRISAICHESCCYFKSLINK